MTDYRKQYSEHQKRVERYVSALDRIYGKAINRITGLCTLGRFAEKEGKTFAFSQYPNAEKEVNDALRGMGDAMLSLVSSSIEEEWKYAEKEGDGLVREVFGKRSDGDARFKQYHVRNVEALSAFEKRKEKGLGLSDRVWNNTEGFRQEVELCVGLGIGEGKSAAQLSRDVRKYLKEPDKLFRRVKDKYGEKLVRSEKSKLFHPNSGAYRSSYKNAVRMTRTEINMAYRTSESVRWQNMDFVVGFEVRRSNHEYDCPLCSSLAGKYPKEFKFTGWHPQCRCYVVPILKTEDEIDADTERILRGEESVDCKASKNYVPDIPGGFSQWVRDNRERITLARSRGTEPYFLRDNKKIIDRIVMSEKESDIPYAIKESDLSALRGKGSIGDDVTMKSWKNSALSGINPIRVEKEIFAKVSEKGGACDSIVWNVRRNYGDVKIKGDGVEIKREFYMRGDGLEAWHSFFRLDERLQGKGISKTVTRTFYEEYKRMGVVRIKLHADIDVGGYCWAKYGFASLDKETAIGAIQKGCLTDGQYSEVISLIDGFYRDKPETTPFPMSKIAGLPYGKDALMNGDWYGVLDMSDVRQTKEFERYLGM